MHAHDRTKLKVTLLKSVYILFLIKNLFFAVFIEFIWGAKILTPCECWMLVRRFWHLSKRTEKNTWKIVIRDKQLNETGSRAGSGTSRTKYKNRVELMISWTS